MTIRPAKDIVTGVTEREQDRARWAGKMDCSMDKHENVPFASVGGLAARGALARLGAAEVLRVPRYIHPVFAGDYLEGYRQSARELYGADWETAEFGWKPALTITP